MIENLILSVLFFSALILAFLCGLLISNLKRDVESLKPVYKPSESELEQQRRLRTEYLNFMTYNGDEQ